jgi:pterin-4a-carbinolamine dehydratase
VNVRLKPERIQDRTLPVTPEHLQEKKREIGDWQVDATPNAMYRHFPQPSFSASAAFLTKAVPQIEKHDRAPFVFVDATGVTVRLGNAPHSGVTEADLDLAAALITIA